QAVGPLGVWYSYPATTIQKKRRSDSITNFYFTEPAWRLLQHNLPLADIVALPLISCTRSGCRSIRPGARRLDHRQPLCHFRPMMRGERLRRRLIAGNNSLAEVGRAPLQVRLAQRGRDGPVDPGYDIARRPFRRPDATPSGDMKLRPAGLLDGRDLGRGR